MGGFHSLGVGGCINLCPIPPHYKPCRKNYRSAQHRRHRRTEKCPAVSLGGNLFLGFRHSAAGFVLNIAVGLNIIQLIIIAVFEFHKSSASSTFLSCPLARDSLVLTVEGLVLVISAISATEYPI